MAIQLLASKSGRVHVCGHRGYSLHYPENTLPALMAAKAWGANSVEIDVVLTADSEPVVLHDLTLDRTIDGLGFVADLSFASIRSLDAGSWFHSRFAGTRIPALVDVLDWAVREDMVVVLEIKETEQRELAIDRIVDLISETGTANR